MDAASMELEWTPQIINKNEVTASEVITVNRHKTCK